jgi:uroporphyrin-III C-methyltransferase/precorrin-2 dehydrogenase/sirohydrochlorin ferrochelatase
MAAALGVSLTHRDLAQSVRFVTGHARSGELPEDMDWRGLADPKTSLVVYMGGRTAAGFARQLLAKGMAPSTPLAAVASVSRRDERKWCGTIGQVANEGLPLELTAPVLIGIGTAFKQVRTMRARQVPAVA